MAEQVERRIRHLEAEHGVMREMFEDTHRLEREIRDARADWTRPQEEPTPKCPKCGGPTVGYPYPYCPRCA